ncbi:MAG: hypothetical protein AABX33_01985 [Nanoarchaeota archaeon]
MTSSISGTPVPFPSYAVVKSGVEYILAIAGQINANQSSGVSQQEFDLVEIFMRDFLSVPLNHPIYRDYDSLKIANLYEAIRKHYEQTEKPQKALPAGHPLDNASPLEIYILKQIDEMRTASELIKRGEAHDLQLRPLHEYQETLEMLLHIRDPNSAIVMLVSDAEEVVKAFRIIEGDVS